jgi:hypothetical protein
MRPKRFAAAALAVALLSIAALAGGSPASAEPPAELTGTTTITLTAGQVAALPRPTGLSITDHQVKVWDDLPASIGQQVVVRWDCVTLFGFATQTTSAALQGVNQLTPGAVLPYVYAANNACSLTYTYPTTFGAPAITVVRSGLGPGLASVSIHHD